MARSDDIAKAIRAAAARYGLPVNVLRAFARIESGGNPQAQTGSYKGLFQLSDREFRRFGEGDIFDPTANANAAAAMLAAHSADWTRRTGRPPSPSELYMIHQQGAGGARAHYANPDAPAWRNMLSTGEGQDRGEQWARQAIWGNIPEDMRRRFGSVDNVTSRDFINLWTNKVSRFAGREADGAQDSLSPLSQTSGPVANAGPNQSGSDPLTEQTPPGTDLPTKPGNIADTTASPIFERVTLGSLFGISPSSETGGALAGIGQGLSAAGKALSKGSKVVASLPAGPALPDQDDRAFALPPPIPRTPPGQPVPDLLGRRRRGQA